MHSVSRRDIRAKFTVISSISSFGENYLQIARLKLITKTIPWKITWLSLPQESTRVACIVQLSRSLLFCVSSPSSRLRGRCNRGRKGSEGGEKKWGGLARGKRERLPQESHSFHFCVGSQTQISVWLIFDSKSLENWSNLIPLTPFPAIQKQNFAYTTQENTHTTM